MSNVNEAKGVPLSTLVVGQRGRVTAVLGGIFRDRLFELGFVPGTDVYVRRFAPLRDPVELELRGTRICLRRNETRTISVRVSSE